MALLDLCHPAVLRLNDGGMNNGIQLVDAVWEGTCSELLAINRSVVIQNFAPESADHPFIGDRPRSVELVSEFIGRKIMSTAMQQHLADRRFPASYTAREPYAQHTSPRAAIAVMEECDMRLPGTSAV